MSDTQKRLHDYKKTTERLVSQFIPIVMKELKKDPTLGFLASIEAVKHITMTVIYAAFQSGIDLPDDIPGIFIRFLRPWEKLQDQWGTIPMEKFLEKFDEAYISQFDFENEEQKEFVLNEIKGNRKGK